MPKGTNYGEAEQGQMSAPSADEVAKRAYELFEKRGGEPGHELEDWLTAEAELSGGSEAAVGSSSVSGGQTNEPDRDEADISASGGTAGAPSPKRRTGNTGRRRTADRAP